MDRGLGAASLRKVARSYPPPLRGVPTASAASSLPSERFQRTALSGASFVSAI